jgi:hypothetical protein
VREEPPAAAQEEGGVGEPLAVRYRETGDITLYDRIAITELMFEEPKFRPPKRTFILGLLMEGHVMIRCSCIFYMCLVV